MAPVVTNLWRAAVKGLDGDELQEAELFPRLGLPSDRRWALRYDDVEGEAPAGPPGWLHKSNFLCSFTAGPLLRDFRCAFNDQGQELAVVSRVTGEERLRVRLSDEHGRALLEEFFGSVCGRKLRLVQGEHFGNTPKGSTMGSGDLPIIHIVNAETVAAVSMCKGVPALHPSRFRANITIAGLPAWEEFGMVGGEIAIGGARLKVLSRTVRCDATRVDYSHPDEPEADVPALLQRHFPEHGPFLGIYAQVLQAGPVKVGDSVSVLVAGPATAAARAKRRWALVALLLAPVAAAIARSSRQW